ncbi:MAG: T9SS type A sorting domain-containing protein [Fidelibacterota bacterium]
MKKLITYAILVALLFSVGLIAEPLDGQPLQKTAATTAGQVTRSLSNISNWAYWVYYNGQSAHAPDGSSGGVYPRSTAGAIYQDGFVWGGKYDDNDIRVGGQTYNIGTKPGWVITGGEYDDPNVEVADPSDPAVRVYRIRPDYESLTHSTLIQDAAEQNSTDPSNVTSAMTQEIMDQYALDWDEWPVEHGAPYYDHDEDDVYTAGVDEPGIAQADQVVWYAVNDYSVSATTGLYGSNPIGVELQSTLWAYNQPGVRLGQIIFKSFKLINKSGKTITDMYVSQWSDPDVGSASNDFAGCDTSLSLGYAYNGESSDGDYSAFDLAPAAVGYDFFQGPIVPGAAGDTAIFELEYMPGYKNLPMTSFGWFAAGSNIDDPTLGEYEGTLQFYNLIRGYIPTDDVNDPTPWRIGNVSSNATTMYPLSGDPVAGTGDLDGTAEYFNPGDRRICLSSGPFDFAPGDVQEVVVAVLGGMGSDNIGSVDDLKTTDAVAQELFDGLFREVPKPPVSPNVTARPLENTVSLEWGSDKERVAEIEETVVSGYEFEGYNVYQLPSSSATKGQAKRIATFDVVNGIKLIYETRTPNEFEGEDVSVPIIYGDDTGVQRYIVIDWDYINDKPLYEGSTYYFAVTAYNQNHDEGRLAEKAMESSIVPLGVTLQEPPPGNAINTEPESDVPVVHSAGPGDGQVGVTVVDPFAITGHDYKVTFNWNADSSAILYNVTDITDDVVLSTGNQQVASLDDKGGAPVVDGVEVKVSGPELGLKSVQQFDQDDNLIDDGVSILEFSLGPPGYIVSNLAGDVNLDPYASDFDRFNIWEMDDIEIDFSDSSVAWQYATVQEECLTEKVPFAVYRHNFETGVKERLFIAIYDQGYGDSTAALGMGVWDTTGTDGLFGATTYEPIYAYVGPEPYDPAKEAQYIAADQLSAAPSNTGFLVPSNPFGYPFLNATLIVDYFGNSADPEMNYIGYPEGDKIMFSTNKINTLADEYSFSTAGLDPTSSDSLMALAIEKINVFPNPYYAYNEQATSAYDQYVTFTHLPGKATIKIFNLAGVLVNTIEHDNASSQFARWDLTNASNIPVGSGMYIAHINMPDVGEQKVLKFMVIQNKQILEYY